MLFSSSNKTAPSKKPPPTSSSAFLRFESAVNVLTCFVPYEESHLIVLGATLRSGMKLSTRHRCVFFHHSTGSTPSTPPCNVDTFSIIKVANIFKFRFLSISQPYPYLTMSNLRYFLFCDHRHYKFPQNRYDIQISNQKTLKNQENFPQKIQKNSRKNRKIGISLLSRSERLFIIGLKNSSISRCLFPLINN